MIAKCGPRRIWHWAHFGERKCDVWWEPETDWHRDWKNQFEHTWQEVPHAATDGEKHIADVKTPHGLVIEFQRSFLNQQELSREAFYRPMVWVVDGTRLKRARKRFFDAVARGPFPNPDVFVTHFVEECLPVEWLDSSVPVYFDFGDGNEPDDPFLIERPVLWCLLPQRAMGNAVIVAVAKELFVRACRTGVVPFGDGKLVHDITTGIERQRLADRQPLAAFEAYAARRSRLRPRF